MKQISINHIILLGIVAILLNNFLSENKEGMSDEAVEWKIKFHDKEQEYNLLNKQFSQYDIKVKKLFDEKPKIDSIVDGYNKSQLDSFYTTYFAR